MWDLVQVCNLGGFAFGTFNRRTGGTRVPDALTVAFVEEWMNRAGGQQDSLSERKKANTLLADLSFPKEPWAGKAGFGVGLYQRKVLVKPEHVLGA